MATLGEKVFSGQVNLFDITNKPVRVFKVTEDHSIMGWLIKLDSREACETVLVTMPYHKFDQKNLEIIGVWDKLTDSERSNVTDSIPLEISNTDTSSKKRRGSFMFVCSNCGHDEKISYSALKIKLHCQDDPEDVIMEKVNVYLEEDYICSKCRPKKKKGRTRNPLYKDIPRSVPCCVCKKACSVPSAKIYELTGGDVDKIKEYSTSYKCRSCNPDWGSWLKGKRGKKKV